MFQVPGKNQYHSITLKSDKNRASLKKSWGFPKKTNSGNRSVECLKFFVEAKTLPETNCLPMEHPLSFSW